MLYSFGFNLWPAYPDYQSTESLRQQISELPSIEGKLQYLTSPFVTAGDRVYIIGYQNGSFPDQAGILRLKWVESGII